MGWAIKAPNHTPCVLISHDRLLLSGTLFVVACLLGSSSATQLLSLRGGAVRNACMHAWEACTRSQPASAPACPPGQPALDPIPPVPITPPVSPRSCSQKEKVAIIGSGNWGSAIAKVVGRNLLNLDGFEDEVRMWVYQEQVDGKNLTDIINEKHENVK